MAAVAICSDFGAQENKIRHCFHCFSIYLPWSDGTGCLDVHFFFFLSFCSVVVKLLIYFTLPHYIGFAIHWLESTMSGHVFPILNTLPTSLSTQFLWVFPVYQARTLVSCIQPGLMICFTLDNIPVSMLFSRNIPPSPSPTESKILFCNLWLFFCFAYKVIITIFLNSIYMY